MRGSVGLGLSAALAAATWCVPACAQQGRYPEQGHYGGGLIEYLVTGSPGEGSRSGSQRAAAPPQRVAAYSGDPLQDDRGPARVAVAPQAYGVPGGADPARIARGIDPQYLRQEVEFTGSQKPGTIVIDTPGKHLYLVQPGHRALRYGIGVGRPGFAWNGLKTVSRKAEWPDWTPPPEMLARRPDLPRHMEGGPGNPLGARALYLGSSLYRIHGTNEPHTIGQSVSSGCIRMMNEDVTDLYERVPVGTRVEVL